MPFFNSQGPIRDLLEGSRTVHTCALLYPRGDHYGRDPDTQPVELEEKRRWPHDPIRARDTTNRGGHVIEEPTMLIVRDH